VSAAAGSVSDPAAGRAPAVPLTRVVARLEREHLLVRAPAAEVELFGIADDSRRARVGDLFCAWAGTAVDSHGYVPEAVAAGAVAVLVERPVDVDVPQVVVRDGRRAAGLAAAELFGDPARELTLVGVTGTNGKTTTVWLLRYLLGDTRRAASIGTLGVLLPEGPLGEGEALTTPGPVELARTLRQLRERDVEAVAVEVSSHALDQGRVEALRFDVVVFTNLTRDHLDYHGTPEAYRDAKLRLADLLKSNGTAVYNADDSAWTGVPDRAGRAIGFSATGSRGADVRAESIQLRADGARFELATADGSAAVALPLLGEFNVANALGAGAACLGLGDGLDRVARRLSSAPQVPGRLERIADRPCPVLRDYSHTPDALERALLALRPLVEGRLIVVFGAGGDRDRGKRPLMGRVAVERADVVIVTSDNPRTEDPDAIIDEIEAGMGDAPRERVTDRRQAIARALALGRPGDLILLAGKGHETYQVVGTQKRDFDERNVVAELLRQMGQSEVRA
jgi:UDP-N-acetylmuramoyl-L-alanyl-D-glutamate--2,6-diaminopimelate ligase